MQDEAGRRTDEWRLPGYTQVRELGAGASGRVVLAHHDGTGTPVAIKYLLDAVDGSGLREEAEVLARVDSPYVTRLYEYVEAGPHAAIVMELVDGVSLRTLLRSEGATTPEAALVVLKGSLLGLAAAHAAGLVHRDYKPANVLVAADGFTKLVDFGIAVPSGDDRDISGTPAYLAPEQWTGAPASPAADVYAATVTFFECLTGTRPFPGRTVVELAVQHRELRVPDELVPERVRPLVLAGMAKQPEQRPGGAAEFVRHLEAVATAGYGEQWEERGRADLVALVGLLALLLPWGAAGPPPGGATALDRTELVAGRGAAASRAEHEPGGGASASREARPRRGASARRTVRRPRLREQVRVEHPRRARRRRARAVAGAVVGTLAVASLAGVALAGVADRADRTVTGSPMPRVTTTLDASGGAGGEATDGPADPTTPAGPSGTGAPGRPPSPSASPTPSPFLSPAPDPSADPSTDPPKPRPGTPVPPPTPGPGTTSSRAAGPTSGAGPSRPPTSATTPPPVPRITDTPRTTPPPAGPVTATPVTPRPTVVTATPVPVRVTSLSVDSVSCLNNGNHGIEATITVVTSGPPGATLIVSWQHHSGAINPPVTVATETVRLGTGSVTLTRSHDFGNDDKLQWGVRVGSDPRPENTSTAYRELPAIDCRQPG
ncbi:serine/threonine-protein kinase [Kitasatospora sp. NPDC047058]|uniref:serine/threonine-protein kinase n=1 Tax=Kitasatospora sp. NPDC047058 TaxID=3155620 RepID=UPI0033E2712C